MSFSEKCRQCSVMVDGGSGVLFQPMTEEYSYVLTAKHNLYNDTTYGSYEQSKCIENIRVGESQCTILGRFEHNNLDIAILKICKVDFKTPLKHFDKIKRGNNYAFYGYPHNLRNVEDKLKCFNLQVVEVLQQEIRVDNLNHYTQNDISGCSGGGVFNENEDEFFLVGVECRMDAQSGSEENNTRLRFIYIAAFDEIIEQNSSELAPLYPPYMNDFNLLVDNIYLLNDYEAKRKLVRDRIKYFAKTYVTEVTPITIHNEFKNELLINGFDVNHITNSELWQMYLEFILLSILVDSKECLSLEKIKEIYKKRKILFAKSERWIELKENILKSDLRGLQENSTVFIACIGDRRPNKVDISSTITDVSQAPQPEEMRIDQHIDYTVDIKYKHIYAIEKILLDSESEFDSATNINIDGILGRVLQNVS